MLAYEMIVRFTKILNVSSVMIPGICDYEHVSYSPSRKIMKRLMKIENVTPVDQKALLKTIDKYIQSL